MSDKLKIMQEKLNGSDCSAEDNNLVPAEVNAAIAGEEQPWIDFPQEASAS